MHKELEWLASGVAGAMFTLRRDKEIVPGLDRLPAVVDISFSMTLTHNNGICLFFVLIDGISEPGAISIRQTLAIIDSLLVKYIAALALSNMGCLAKIIFRWG